MRAAQLANAHNFIMETTDKYETDVGEKGSQMSGGQKVSILCITLNHAFVPFLI